VGQRFLYREAVHEEAIARLDYLIGERRRLGLLIGDRRTGKTLLLNVFADQLRRRGWPVAVLNLAGIGIDELDRELAFQLGFLPRQRDPRFRDWQRLRDRLIAGGLDRLPAALLLDDGHAAEPAVLRQIARLAELNRTSDARLTVVIAAAASELGRLGARLLDLASLRIDLNAWDQGADPTSAHHGMSAKRTSPCVTVTPSSS